MFRQRRVPALAPLIILIVAITATGTIVVGQAQTPENLLAQSIVDLARDAKFQVSRLVDSVHSNDQALQKIAAVSLTAQFEGNVSIYDQGAASLSEAETALENAEYEQAISNSQAAFQAFRQAFKSINQILVDAGLETDQGINFSDLFDATNRTLGRIAYLRALLLPNATDQLAKLNQAETLLNSTRTENFVLQGNSSGAADNLRQAEELVGQVYQSLKLQAEETNTIRICSYLQEMDQTRETLRERLRYAESLGLNMDGIYSSLGYHNETEFMNALQNMTQNAEGRAGNLTEVSGYLNALGQKLQQTNQTLTQEINRYQAQHGQGGNSNGNSSAGPSNTPSTTTTPGTSSDPVSTDNGTGNNSSATGNTNGPGPTSNSTSGPTSSPGTSETNGSGAGTNATELGPTSSASTPIGTTPPETPAQGTGSGSSGTTQSPPTTSDPGGSGSGTGGGNGTPGPSPTDPESSSQPGTGGTGDSSGGKDR